MARKADPELREERRRQVLDAARECFIHQGFRGASINDICAAAGIGPGLLYHYFPSKEALIEAIAERDAARTLDLLRAASAHPDFIEGLLTEGLQELASPTLDLDGPLSAEILAEAARNPRVAAILRDYMRQMDEQLRGVLRAAQSEGRLARDIDPDDATLLLTVVAEGYLLRRTADPDFHSGARIDRLRVLLQRALGMPKRP